MALFSCPDFVRKLIEYQRQYFSPLDHEHPDYENPDLSGYATDQELADGLATKADDPPVNDGRYYTESEVDALLADKADDPPVNDGRYYTESEVDALLADKADDPPVNDGRYYTESEVDALLAGVSSGAIVGEIRWYTSLFVPSLWLICNGDGFDPGTYTRLYSVIGWNFGSNGGQPALPNLMDKFPMGASISHAMGTTGGEATHTLTEAEMPEHEHPPAYYDRYLFFRVNGGTVSPFQAGGHLMSGAYTTTGSAGGGQPHNNLPPYLSLVPIIYAGQ